MGPASDEPGSDLVGAIEAIRSGVIASNPQLYRHLALYLQVLRQSLPERVERACFHLATRFHSRRYLALDAAARRGLHRRVAAHVLRCSSLLTVEQLAVLAAQMARESARRRRRLQRRLLERLARVSDSDPSADLVHPTPDESPEAALADLQAQPDGSEPGFVVQTSLPFSLRLIEEPEAAPAELIATGLRPRPDGGGGHSADDEDDGDATGESEASPWAVEGGDPSLWQQGRLPDDPLELLRWLDGMELALQRRLRNLSHGINVELLRVGLSPTLLPVSLLDAALQGRVDSAQAPPQLLVLPLPFPSPGLVDRPRAMALLLRSTDLELEEPRLRTCRRRLQHHRQELRRMADRFRRLQRRLDIHQAERLWLQDLPQAAPGAD